MNEHVLVPLAPGFEEIEAITLVDVLRRADLQVTTASLEPGNVEGAHGIAVVPDTWIERVDSAGVTMIVLPGGMPGTKHLMEDERVLQLVRELDARGARTAAICAAPMVLSRAGVVAGLEVTAHPSVRSELGEARVLEAPRVVRSGRVMTSQAAGTALEFALAIVEELCGPAKVEELNATLLARL